LESARPVTLAMALCPLPLRAVLSVLPIAWAACRVLHVPIVNMAILLIVPIFVNYVPASLQVVPSVIQPVVASIVIQDILCLTMELVYLVLIYVRRVIIREQAHVIICVIWEAHMSI